MQNGKILGGGSKPSQLPFSKLDRKQSWEIVAGLEPPRKIIRPVVMFEAWPNAKFYRITSPMDGYARLLGNANDAIELLYERILVSERCGDFDESVTLPLIKLWECTS